MSGTGYKEGKVTVNSTKESIEYPAFVVPLVLVFVLGILIGLTGHEVYIQRYSAPLSSLDGKPLTPGSLHTVQVDWYDRNDLNNLPPDNLTTRYGGPITMRRHNSKSYLEITLAGGREAMAEDSAGTLTVRVPTNAVDNFYEFQSWEPAASGQFSSKAQ